MFAITIYDEKHRRKFLHGVDVSDESLLLVMIQMTAVGRLLPLSYFSVLHPLVA